MCVICVHFHHFKGSLSYHSSSYYYLMQGFVLISFQIYSKDFLVILFIFVNKVSEYASEYGLKV